LGKYLGCSRLPVSNIPLGKFIAVKLAKTHDYPIWDNYMNSRITIDTPTDLGRAIRSARKKHKLTLLLCAAANGVSVRFLSELERGKPGASIGAALKIARSVGLRAWVEEVD